MWGSSVVVNATTMGPSFSPTNAPIVADIAADIARGGAAEVRRAPPPEGLITTAATAGVARSSASAEPLLPVLDVAPLLRGDPGALERLASELRAACEGVGFYYLENFDALLPDDTCRALLAAAAAAHRAPPAVKDSWLLDESDSGYMPVGANTRWGSDGRPHLPVYPGVNEVRVGTYADGTPALGPLQYPVLSTISNTACHACSMQSSICIAAVN
jgi:hypothetical protein